MTFTSSSQPTKSWCSTAPSTTTVATTSGMLSSHVSRTEHGCTFGSCMPNLLSIGACLAEDSLSYLRRGPSDRRRFGPCSWQCLDGDCAPVYRLHPYLIAVEQPHAHKSVRISSVNFYHPG